MLSPWTPVLWVIGLSIPLLLLTRWLHLHLQGLSLIASGSEQSALLLHYLLLLPGILLHELSHVVAARLVGVRARSLSLRPKSSRGGGLRFGSVTVAASDPIRESWIGFAPLLSGMLAILLLARWQFGVDSPPSLTVYGIGRAFSQAMRAPDALVGLYVMFAISNSMWPSESDRQPWGVVALVLGAIAVLAYVSGMFSAIPAGVGTWIGALASHLAFVFALVITLDLPVAVLVLLLEIAGSHLLGRRVEY
jgi:hypothetical protein